MLESILEGCRKGRRKHQKALYQRFYGYGMSITLRYTDTREEAVEVLNDAFLKVFDNIDRFDLTRPFKPWFRTITVRTAINHYHSRKRNFETRTLELHETFLAEPETILSSISYDEMVEMVQSLTPAYRTVFNLFVIEGFTHKEIAELLGITPGTSKSNLAKAKRNLRSILNNRSKVVKRHDRKGS